MTANTTQNLDSLKLLLDDEEANKLSSLIQFYPEFSTIINNLNQKLSSNSQFCNIIELSKQLQLFKEELKQKELKISQNDTVGTILSNIIADTSDKDNLTDLFGQFEHVLATQVQEQHRSNTRYYEEFLKSSQLNDRLIKSEEALNKYSQLLQSSIEEVTNKNSEIRVLESTKDKISVQKEAFENQLNFYRRQAQELQDKLTKEQLLNPIQYSNSKLVIEELRNQTTNQSLTISDLLKQLNIKTTEVVKLNEQLFKNSAQMQSDEILYTMNLEQIMSKLKHSEFMIECHQSDKGGLFEMVANLESEFNSSKEEKARLEEEISMLKAQNSMLSKQMTEFVNNSSRASNLHENGYTQESIGDTNKEQTQEAYLQLSRAYNDLRLENNHLADINREVIHELNTKSKCFSNQSDEVSKIGQAFSQNANLLADIVLERDELKTRKEALESENSELKENDRALRYINHQLCSQIQTLLHQIKLDDEKYPTPVNSSESENYEEIYKNFEYVDIESLQLCNVNLNEMVKKLHDHIKALENKSDNYIDNSESGTLQHISSESNLSKEFINFKNTIIQKYNQENLCLANTLKEFSILFKMKFYNNDDQSTSFISILDNITNQASRYGNLKEQFDLFLNQIYTDHKSMEGERYRLVEELNKSKMSLIEFKSRVKYLESQLKPLQSDLKNLTDLGLDQRSKIELLNTKLLISHNQLDSLTQVPSYQIQQQCKALQNDLNMARDFNDKLNDQFIKIQNEYQLNIEQNEKLMGQQKILEFVNESINSQLKNPLTEERIQSLVEDVRALEEKVTQLESDKELLRLHLSSEQQRASQLSREFHKSTDKHFQSMQGLLEKIQNYKSKEMALNNTINQLNIRNEELEAEAPLPTFDQTKFQELQVRCDQLEADNYALECQLITSSEMQMEMKSAIDTINSEKTQLIAKFEEDSKVLRKLIESIKQENSILATKAEVYIETINRLQIENKNVLNDKEDLKESKEDESRNFKLQLNKVELDRANFEALFLKEKGEGERILKAYHSALQQNMLLKDTLKSKFKDTFEHEMPQTPPKP